MDAAILPTTELPSTSPWSLPVIGASITRRVSTFTKQAQANFGPLTSSDVQILPKFVSLGKSVTKISHKCSCMIPGLSRALSFTGVLSAISIPFTARDLGRDVKSIAEEKNSGRRLEFGVSAVSGFSDIAVSVASVAGGIKALTSGTPIGGFVSAGTTGWTTPVTMVGLGVLLGCTMITRGLAVRRTLRALRELNPSGDGDANSKLTTLFQKLSRRDATYLKTWFMTEKPEIVHDKSVALHEGLQEAFEANKEEAQQFVKTLKGRARTKLGREVLGMAMMIAAFAGAVILTFTAATPIGWTLIGLVAIGKISTFVFDRVYKRTGL